MKRKTIYMGTTKIDAQTTAGEIVSELVKAGATSINTDYVHGAISGLRWVMPVNGTAALFDMPVRVEPVLKLIGDKDQAVRVAWRQLLRWVQAQNAMIETGMVEAAEVYFAYHIPAGHDQGLFELAMKNQFEFRALPAAAAKQ